MKKFKDTYAEKSVYPFYQRENMIILGDMKDLEQKTYDNEIYELKRRIVYGVIVNDDDEIRISEDVFKARKEMDRIEVLYNNIYFKKINHKFKCRFMDIIPYKLIREFREQFKTVEMFSVGFHLGKKRSQNNIERDYVV